LYCASKVTHSYLWFFQNLLSPTAIYFTLTLLLVKMPRDVVTESQSDIVSGLSNIRKATTPFKSLKRSLNSSDLFGLTHYSSSPVKTKGEVRSLKKRRNSIDLFNHISINEETRHTHLCRTNDLGSTSYVADDIFDYSSFFCQMSTSSNSTANIDLVRGPLTKMIDRISLGYEYELCASSN